MAAERTLARRYARALLDVAKEQGVIGEVERDLGGIAELWATSADLRTVIHHPLVAPDRKRKAVRAALKGRVLDLTIRFVEILIDKRRLDVIAAIAEEFGEAANESRDLAEVHVRAFMPLTDAQRERLVTKLRAFTNRGNIEIKEEVDPGLLGGIVVRIGDQVLDGSMTGRLRHLREHLIVREDERTQQAAAAAAEALGE